MRKLWIWITDLKYSHYHKRNNRVKECQIKTQIVRETDALGVLPKPRETTACLPSSHKFGKCCSQRNWWVWLFTCKSKTVICTHSQIPTHVAAHEIVSDKNKTVLPVCLHINIIVLLHKSLHTYPPSLRESFPAFSYWKIIHFCLKGFVEWGLLSLRYKLSLMAALHWVVIHLQWECLCLFVCMRVWPAYAFLVNRCVFNVSNEMLWQIIHLIFRERSIHKTIGAVTFTDDSVDFVAVGWELGQKSLFYKWCGIILKSILNSKAFLSKFFKHTAAIKTLNCLVNYNTVYWYTRE